MEFKGISLKTSDKNIEHLNKEQDIERINTVISPYGLKVNDVKESAQVIRYIENL